MFKLDMQALRESAASAWLMANPANPANSGGQVANATVLEPEISQKTPKLAGLATVAISQQVSHESAELLTARLIAAAMRACDFHGDSPEGRERMRQDCLCTSTDLHQELLEHFNDAYPARRRARARGEL